jgi:hypothetical protein
MMLAKAGIIALMIAAGLVATVPFADAQGNQTTPQIQDQKLTEAFTVFKSKSDEVIERSTAYLQFTEEVNGVRRWKVVPGSDAAREKIEEDLQHAIQQRDEAANQLAVALDAPMKRAANNEKLGKQLEQVYNQIQAINKDTGDALLLHDQSVALLDERAAADKAAAAGATER